MGPAGRGGSASSGAPLLVTGAAGFIGARFVESCLARGIPFVAVDAPGHFAERKEHREIAFGRVVDREALPGWLEAERPALRGIVHLGACTDTTQMDVALLERLNVAYSRALWRFASREGVPFVYASSAATYGDGSLGYDDDESKISLLRPLNPYGESKQRFDVWALDEEAQGVRPPAWAGFKFFNVYGFGERHKAGMSSVVLQGFDQIQRCGEMRLFRSHRPGVADGHQTRDFVSVADVIDVLHFALDAPLCRGIFNLGTGQGRTFLDLARATFSALGAEERIVFVDTPPGLRERYQYFTEARMEKLRAAGYRHPFTPLEQGVREYVQRLLRG
ncbi:MAG: ADP-glyceromanno-heptose 6-epimerase [Deltaproteobacteria bacterium]|nr:ADP-glyceromanno-heptose 6-epimerase [Deltaproteobacteria bacterium]